MTSPTTSIFQRYIKRLTPRLKRGIALFKDDPGLFAHKIIVKLRLLFLRSSKPITTDISGVRFRFDLSYDPAIRLMYVGGYEIETITVMRDLLNPGDTFLDIGANIGYLSAIAAGLVGKKGSVHAFEPVPEYFKRLRDFKELNLEYAITVNNIALGETRKSSRIAVSDYSNIGWNTMVSGYMKERMLKEVIDINVIPLDDYISEKKLVSVSLMKIDTEGYEYFVFLGMSNFLTETPTKPAILCEINADAYRFTDHSLSDLDTLIRDLGYRAYEVSKRRAPVSIPSLTTNTDVLLLPK